MSDSNAPSWLTAPAITAPSASSLAEEKPAKSGGVFSLFAKGTPTAHVQAATTHQPSSPIKNIASAPDDGFTPAWAMAKALTSPQDIENRGDPVTSENKGPVPLHLDPVLLSRMQFYHWVLRIAYMNAAILMGAAAGYSLVGQTNVSAAFFAIYVMFFCLIMCCFEVGLNVSIGFRRFWAACHTYGHNALLHAYRSISPERPFRCLCPTYVDFSHLIFSSHMFLSLTCTVHFVNHRYQLWIPLHLDRKSDISFVCRYHELQPIRFRQSGYGVPLPGRSSACCDYVYFPEILSICQTERFLWI